MERITMSRRRLLEAGAWTLTAAALTPKVARSAGAPSGLSPADERAVRQFYAAWGTKNWALIDAVLADDFTFTSPNGDDHISKSVYKPRCWESQVGYVQSLDVQQLIGHGTDAFVMYIGHVRNGKTFRNVEYVRVENGKLKSIECYFGQANSFASAVGGT
jgi:ketosteroid isomerase-like protein